MSRPDMRNPWVYLVVGTVVLVVSGVIVARITGSGDSLSTPETTTTSTSTSTTATTQAPVETTQPPSISTVAVPSTSTTATATTSTTSTTTTTLPVVYLASIEKIDDDRLATRGYKTDVAVFSDVAYPRSVFIDPSGEYRGWVEYALGGRYQCLQTLIGVIEDAKSGADFAVTISDGIDESPRDSITVDLSGPEEWSVDITDLVRMRVEVSQINEGFEGYIGGQYVILADARVSADPCS